MSTKETLNLQLKRSPIGTTERQRATLRALGLGRVGTSSSVKADPATLGRIRRVQHLLKVDGK